MIATIRAEFRKTVRRPALLVVLALVAVVPMLVYAADYYGQLHSTDPGAPDLREFYPIEFVHFIISAAFPIGAAIALVLGALLAGSEYSWSTLKTALTQRPGRSTVFAGRFAVFQAWLAVLVLVMFGFAALSSVFVALLQGHAITWPAAADVIKGFGAAWLTMATYGSLGLLLGHVFRQAAVALGVGLIYIALIEDVLLNFLDSFNGGQFKWVADLFDGQNALSLLAIFTSPSFGRPRHPEVDAVHAVATLAAYVTVFVVLGGVLFCRRDVT